ncbi:hypothetical protein E2320_014085, partial [Naja naja]
MDISRDGSFWKPPLS